MLGGENQVSEDQLKISLENLLENEAHKPPPELAILQIPDLKALSRSVRSHLIHTQRI